VIGVDGGKWFSVVRVTSVQYRIVQEAGS